jgi:hypothetical protein
MLRNKIKLTKELMEKTKVALSVQERYRRSKDFSELVKDKLPAMVKVVTAVRLVENTYPMQWKLPNVRETIRLVTELISNIEQQPREKFGQIQRSLEPFMSDAKNQWPDIAKKQHMDIKKALLVFRRVRKNDPVLEQLIQTFDTIEKTWPVMDKSLAHHQKSISEAKDLIASLGASNKIQIFLEKMAAGQATLKDMNDEVIQWIEAQNLTSDIYITFK